MKTPYLALATTVLVASCATPTVHSESTTPSKTAEAIRKVLSVPPSVAISDEERDERRSHLEERIRTHADLLKEERKLKVNEVPAPLTPKPMPLRKRFTEYQESELQAAVPDQLSIQVPSEGKILAIAKILEAQGCQVTVGLYGQVRVTLPESGPAKLKKFAALIDKLDGVESISPRFNNGKVSVGPSPNDWISNEQYEMDHIDSPRAWGYYAIRTNGAPVAVLDTGVDTTVSDLQGVMVDPVDATPTNSPFTVYHPSWDPNRMLDTDGHPEQSHGTAMCSLAAAKTDNGIGQASAAWGNKYMPIIVTENAWFSNDPVPHEDNIRAGVHWAVTHGARVLSCSFELSGTNADLLAAVTEAFNTDTILVAAAGNASANTVSYPAKYASTYPNVIAVAATDTVKTKATFTNSGPEVSIGAPGKSIRVLQGNLSSLPANSPDHYYGGGTSEATAIVAGAINKVRNAASALPAAKIVNYMKLVSNSYPSSATTNNYGGNMGAGIFDFGELSWLLLGSGATFRWYDPTYDQYHYTTDATSTQDGSFQKIGFFVDTNNPPGTVAIFRKYNPATWDELITLDPLEANSLGYTQSVQLGWARPGTSSDSSHQVPIYRMIKPLTSTTYRHAAVPASDKATLEANGWTSEGVVAYCWKGTM